jgi:hypothetical protein
VKYLSQEWLDAGREVDNSLPGQPGLDVGVQFFVSDGPEGDFAYFWVFRDGNLARAERGTIDDPDVTMNMSYDDSAKNHRGEITMQQMLANGSITGDIDTLGRLQALRAPAQHAGVQAGMRDRTEY